MQERFINVSSMVWHRTSIFIKLKVSSNGPRDFSFHMSSACWKNRHFLFSSLCQNRPGLELTASHKRTIYQLSYRFDTILRNWDRRTRGRGDSHIKLANSIIFNILDIIQRTQHLVFYQFCDVLYNVLLFSLCHDD